MSGGGLVRWFDVTVIDLGRHFRVSYLPPLMVYLAAGVSGLTAIVGAFFIKDYLGFSAAFLAGLAFWAGIPWVLKMPLGHIVDLIWRWKSVLVYLGAGLIAASSAIMYALIAHTGTMAEVMTVEVWFVLAALLAPGGYVIQDVVADAMTVEAVPRGRQAGPALSRLHHQTDDTTMRTLGRVAIVTGSTGAGEAWRQSNSATSASEGGARPRGGSRFQVPSPGRRTSPRRQC